MITPEKLRAARAMLGWTREVLAQMSDVSVPTLSSLELDENRVPSGKTSERLLRTFRREGVLFTENGIERKKSDVRLLEGENWFNDLLEDVYYTCIDKPDELIVDMADDRMSPPEVIEAYRRLRRLGVTMRQTVEEGNTYLMGPVAEYRWVPKPFFKNWVTLIYKNKVAISIENETKAMIFTDKDFAENERNKFDLIWSLLPALNVESEANVRF